MPRSFFASRQRIPTLLACLALGPSTLGIITLGLITLGLSSGCQESSRPAAPTRAAGEPLRVLCTVGMLADIVAQVGGESTSVEALMGAGTDPHTYKTSPGDTRRLLGADLVLTCGHHLEGRMGETLTKIGAQVPTRAVCEQLDPALLLRDDEHAAVDPHLWFDVKIWAHCAQVVGTILGEIDPTHAPAYRDRAATVHQKLIDLDEEVRREMAGIPRAQRVLVTAHDAFRYFGRAYDVEVLGVQGLSTDSEAGMQRITELVRIIAERGIQAVFVESTVSQKNVLALVEGCQARGHQLRIGGSLFSDAMGDANTVDGTYEGMVRHNVRTIVEALR